jgi:hypothetical protein
MRYLYRFRKDNKNSTCRFVVFTYYGLTLVIGKILFFRFSGFRKQLKLDFYSNTITYARRANNLKNTKVLTASLRNFAVIFLISRRSCAAGVITISWLPRVFRGSVRFSINDQRSNVICKFL